MQGAPIELHAVARLLAAVLLVAACGAARREDPDPLLEITMEERERFASLVEARRRSLLERETVPAPVVAFTPQRQDRDGLVVTVVPLLAEEQAWNAWPDGTARLFNDSVGYLWKIRLEARYPVKWSVQDTRLAVNDTDQVFSPAPVPEDLLVPLLQSAAWEAAMGAPTDFALRARRAEDFRRAYLPVKASSGAQEGVVVFPAPSRNIHAVAMEITVGVVVEGKGLESFRFLFE